MSRNIGNQRKLHLSVTMHHATTIWKQSKKASLGSNYYAWPIFTHAKSNWICFEQGKSNDESPNQLTVPPVTPPIVGEQRRKNIESLIDSAMSQVANEDCKNSAQHATSFYPAAIMVRTYNIFCLIKIKLSSIC